VDVEMLILRVGISQVEEDVHVILIEKVVDGP
jgi:hypothetical protein